MAAPMLSGGQIFVVDDEVPDLQVMGRILSDAGYESVRQFTDPSVALEVLTYSCPDLIVLDLQMPQLDGLRFLELLRAQASPSDFVPVIVLTADLSRAALRSALAAGANEYVTKPVDAADLLLRVRNLLAIRFCHQELRNTNTALASELRMRSRVDEQVVSDLHHKALAIQRIIDRGGPAMVFQPIVELATGSTVGVEALARFGTEPRRGPDQWFADAIQADVAPALELSAIEAAMKHAPDLDPSFTIAVNVSPNTMLTREFGALAQSLPLSRMSFEVTEHQPIDNYEALNAVVEELRTGGALLAVDDAGAGFASLRHILKLNPDVIKLDIALTRDISVDPVKRALASALVTFAAEIGAAITAEGIETQAELTTLRGLGIDHGQGFFLARPGTAQAAGGSRATIAGGAIGA